MPDFEGFYFIFFSYRLKPTGICPIISHMYHAPDCLLLSSRQESTCFRPPFFHSRPLSTHPADSRALRQCACVCMSAPACASESVQVNLHAYVMRELWGVYGGKRGRNLVVETRLALAPLCEDRREACFGQAQEWKDRHEHILAIPKCAAHIRRDLQSISCFGVPRAFEIVFSSHSSSRRHDG